MCFLLRLQWFQRSGTLTIPARPLVSVKISNRMDAVALCVGVLVLAGCGATNDEGKTPASSESPASSALSSSQLVGPSEFAAAIAEPSRVTINVHVPYEGEIAGTDLSIPFDQITEQVARLPTELSTPLAIYCRTGRMTVVAAAALTTLGYINVLDLQGGMQAWEASGRSLERR